MASGDDSSLPKKESTSLVQAVNYLAVSLHKVLARENENVFFSPFSLSTALAMLYYGSRGETLKEMKNALGYDMACLSDDNLISSFDHLFSIMEKNTESYTLSYANSLVIQKDFIVKEEFKSVLVESFKALMQEVDFQKESEKVVQQINEWVKEKTNGMISRLLNSLEPETVVVLLNAIYFKGSWSQQFEKSSTQFQNFYNRGKQDEIQQVEMMQLRDPFLFMENDIFQALQLLYEGKDIAMLILLPRSLDGLEELEGKLDANFINDVTKQMRKRKVKVALPKFRLEYSKSLKEAFQNLGMNRIFQNGAELGGMSDSKQLEVSDIFHKAVLVVNEEGSEAAAATAVVVVKRCLTIEPCFRVDHPFFFIIYDKRNDLILFIGRVQEL